MPVTLDISIGDKNWTQIIPDGVTVKGGRSSKAQIRIEHDTVSSLHFQLRNIPGGWVIKDLQSTNGILVNNEKISDIALQDGDVIKIGNCTIVFYVGLVGTERPTETDVRKVFRQAETINDDET